LPAVCRAQARPVRRTTRAFELSCAAIGAAAIALSAFVDWSCQDRTGAVLLLLTVAGLIVVLARGAPNDRRIGT
jgi:hypothetical protein